MKNVNLLIYGTTERNRAYQYKPNEDAFFYDAKMGLVALADGVTRSLDAEGKYPKTGTLAPELFIQETKKSVIELLPAKISSEEVIRNTLTAINQKIHEANVGLRIYEKLNYDTVDLLGTTGVLAIISEQENECTLTLGFIGDVLALYLPASNPPKLLTRDQLDACHAYAKPLFQRLASEKGWTLEEAKKQRIIWQRKKIRNSVSALDSAGNQIGFGVLTGEIESLSFIETRVQKIQRSDRVIFSSDALDACAQGEGSRKIEHFQKMLEKIQGLSTEECAHCLIQHIRKCEKKQGKTSDDATVVVVDVG